MADEKEDVPSARAEMPRVRRRAPTIDLTATEVAVEPPPAPPEQELEATGPPGSENAATPEYSTEPPAYEMGDAPSQEPPVREPAETPPPAGAQPHRRFFGPYGMEAGIVGALASLLIFGVLWLAGMFSAPENPPDQRIATMEARLRDLANRQPQTDTKAIDEVAGRIARLESAVQAARNATPGGNVTALEESIKTLQADIARRADENAAAIREARGRADAATAAAESARQAADAARQTGERNNNTNNVEALNTRLAALERSVQTLSDNVSKIAAAANDKPLRTSLAAQALRIAVERGEPFEAELAAAKTVAPDAKVLAPLEPFASTGLPSPQLLARQLVELAPAMLKAEPPPAPSGGFLDRLQANAEKLVRVRPVNETSGSSSEPVGVVRQAQGKIVRGDIAGALADLNKLPEKVRAPADEWMKKAEACGAALAASRRFATDALTALGKSP